MSLSVKASPHVILSALRAVGSSTTIKKSINYALRHPLQQREFPSFSSVAASKDLVDATFNKVLESEINSVKSTLKQSQVKTPTDAFPFEINESEAGTPQLEKHFPDGQKVIVKINPEFIEFTNDDDTCEDGKERDESKKDIPMNVEVHKPGKYCGKIKFDITLSKDDIVIRSLEVNNYRRYVLNSGRYSQLDETQIREMDSELQRCLAKYLEIRGITSNLASFLHKIVFISKKEKELNSLQHLKKFTEK